MLTYIKKYALQITAICLFSMFFTSCKKPPLEIPAGPKEIIVEASVPAKIYTNTKKVDLDASKTSSLNGIRTLKFAWACTNFPATSVKPEIKNPLQPLAWVENLGTGQYKFQLIVKDNLGNIAESSYLLDVLEDTLINVIPIAKAGPDQQINAPKHETDLNGYQTNFFNGVGRTLFYKWTVIKQPPGSIPVIILNADLAAAKATDLQEGIYQFRLEVKNEVGNIGADTMQVTVLPDPLKGTTRIFEDKVWEFYSDEWGTGVSLWIFEPDLFENRYPLNMEVSVWEEEKKDWSETNKYNWTADPNWLTIYYPWNEDEKIYTKEVGKKTRVRVKFL